MGVVRPNDERSDVDTMLTNELKLHVARTRAELEQTIETLRGKLDVKTHSLRAWATLRRDIRATPGAFVLFAVVGGVVGAYVITALTREQMHRG